MRPGAHGARRLAIELAQAVLGRAPRRRALRLKRGDQHPTRYAATFLCCAPRQCGCGCAAAGAARPPAAPPRLTAWCGPWRCNPAGGRPRGTAQLRCMSSTPHSDAAVGVVARLEGAHARVQRHDAARVCRRMGTTMYVWLRRVRRRRKAASILCGRGVGLAGRARELAGAEDAAADAARPAPVAMVHGHRRLAVFAGAELEGGGDGRRPWG